MAVAGASTSTAGSTLRRGLIETVIDEDDLPSLCRGSLRGTEAGLAAADHEHLGSAMLGVEAP